MYGVLLYYAAIVVLLATGVVGTGWFWLLFFLPVLLPFGIFTITFVVLALSLLITEIIEGNNR